MEAADQAVSKFCQAVSILSLARQKTAIPQQGRHGLGINFQGFPVGLGGFGMLALFVLQHRQPGQRFHVAGRNFDHLKNGGFRLRKPAWQALRT